MLVLGIESSCDETAIAALSFAGDGTARVLAERISSQVDLHADYGGVVPELAARMHLQFLPLLSEEIRKDVGFDWPQLDLIAVTRGPGLKGCLLMGLGFAEGLALPHSLPLLGVNHIEGHIFAAALDNSKLECPFLALVVSGGHTEILWVEDLGRYQVVSRTTDDAAGEAFDKSAALLGFPYPGGAALASLADKYSESRFKLPRVMRGSDNFSFSGLKTAIALLVQQQRESLEDPQIKGELAFAVQEAIVGELCIKLRDSIKRCGAKRVVLSGGVSANRRLRQEVSKLSGVEVFLPLPGRSTDNAAMIAYLGGVRYRRGERQQMGLGVLPRWPVEKCFLNVMEGAYAS